MFSCHVSTSFYFQFCTGSYVRFIHCYWFWCSLNIFLLEAINPRNIRAYLRDSLRLSDPVPYWNTCSSSGSLLSYILDLSPLRLEHVQHVSWWYQTTYYSHYRTKPIQYHVNIIKNWKYKLFMFTFKFLVVSLWFSQVPFIRFINHQASGPPDFALYCGFFFLCIIGFLDRFVWKHLWETASRTIF